MAWAASGAMAWASARGWIAAGRSLSHAMEALRHRRPRSIAAVRQQLKRYVSDWQKLPPGHVGQAQQVYGGS
jgi:hypothetical protein